MDPHFPIGAALCGNQYLCRAPSVANVFGYIDCRHNGLGVVGIMTMDSPFSLDRPLVTGLDNIDLWHYSS
jgi:hypothetical protein